MIDVVSYKCTVLQIFVFLGGQLKNVWEVVGSFRLYRFYSVFFCLIFMVFTEPQPAQPAKLRASAIGCAHPGFQLLSAAGGAL